MKKALLLAIVTLTVSFSAWAQIDVLYFQDGLTGIDQMGPALTDLGYNVTQVSDNPTFQAQITGGSYDLVIYASQNFSADPTSAGLLATYVSGGGKAMYWDYNGSSGLSSPFGATFTGNTNNSTVTALAPLAAGLPTNPVTLTNGGWGIFSTGLTPIGGSTTLATFGNGEAAVVINAAGTAIVYGFATDLTPTNDLYKNMIVLLMGNPIFVSPNDSVLCSGQASTVSYDGGANTFNSGNVFYVELSDATGSFASPDTIGMLATTAVTGTINIQLPGGLTPGSGYQIRLTSSDPAITSGPAAITIAPDPVAGMNIPSPLCVDQEFTITSTATISSGSIISHEYNYGEGSTSLLADPQFTYTAAGSYFIAQIVTSNEGCKDTTAQAVTVNASPNSGFSFTDDCAGETISFNSLTAGLSSYFWDFGDGNTSTAEDPDHIYTQPGTYTVSLTTQNAAGCATTTTGTIQIYEIPVAGFDATSACVGDTAFFNNTSFISAGTLTYEWDFGDGNTSTDVNPFNEYAATGNYPVILIATSANGCADTIVKQVSVFLESVSISGTDTTCINSNETYTASTTGAVNYSWTVFGGTITSGTNSPNVEVTWTRAGLDSLLLVTTSQLTGCSDTNIYEVFISNTFPVAAIGGFTNNFNTCAGEQIQFSDLSTIASGSIVSWFWDFGDNSTSTDQNPLKQYPVPGIYDVSLIVTSNLGCSDTTSLTLNVLSPPDANFTANTVCYNDTTVFINTTLIDPLASGFEIYAWDFGDGNTSSAANPTHVYAAPGTYTVTLTVAYDLFIGFVPACTDVEQRTVTVNPLPTADFEYTSACPNDDVVFNNLTSISSGTVTFEWDFGDGNTSILENPTNAYAAEGTYPVTLIATSNNGCADTIVKPVTVFAEPLASFTNDTVCVGNATSFTNASGIATGTLSYFWDFDDAGATSTNINPTHIFSAAGNYDVTLIATSNNGCADTIVITVPVKSEPIADFTVSADSVCLGDTISFFNNSTVVGANIAYTWSFGDGATSSAVDTAHLYTAPGTYTVWLSATDTVTGCTDTAFSSVRVFDEPVANFTATTVCFGTATQFTNNSTIGIGTLSYLWDFNDGNFSTDINPTHTYAAAGTYNVLLTATSNNGCVDTVTVAVIVNEEPIADFTVSADSVCLGDTISFFNNSTVVGANIAYTWSFGDGATSTAVDTAHLYTAPGTYTVWLAATDTVTGCTDTAFSSVRVFDEPVANFTATTVCFGTATQFTNNSTIGIGTLSYLWDFNDGNFSTDINPTHTYAAAGVYNVLLTATSNNGCVDTVTVAVTVNEEPIADFTVSADSVCLGDTISFFNNSTVVGANIAYTWSFGDGATSTAVDTAHLYTAPGTYTVWLAATDTVTGCTDTAFSSVRVFDEPVANFTATTVCFGTATQFTNNSTIGIGTLSYLWDFNDGNFSTDINPTYTYGSAGVYNVLLTVTSNNGCVDTITVPVTVNEEPVSDFSIVDADVCDGDTVFFVDASSSVGADIVYTWNFGDGNTSNVSTSTAHLYGGPGTYNVWLALTDTVTGCTDTSFGTVIVYHEPVAAWTAPDVCIGEPVTFTNGTTLGLGTLNFVWDFGDGTTSTDVNPIHTYTTDGIKTITLAVSTNNGCTDTFTNTIIVYPEPVADFSAGAACFGFPVEFTNLTTIPFGINTWLWEFGDGATSTDSNTTHTYAAMGVYSVTLTATSNAGCTHSVTKTVQINPNPTANFTVNTVCAGDVTVFTNNSSVPTGSFTSFWDFGDGNNSQDADPTHVYGAGGIYTATLIVTSDQGCTDTISKTVTVTPGPVASFIAQPVCYGEANRFSSTSTVPAGGGTIVDVKWLFGDGSVSIEDSPSHIYAAPGTYNASLIVISSNGCRDTVSQAVVVHELPDSTIRPFSSTEFCDGDSVLLSAPAGVGYTYLWSDSSSTQDITVFESGTYCVTVTTQFGCAGSTCINVIKHELPTAYAGEDTAISKGYTAQLRGTGAGLTGGYSWTPIETLDDNFSQTPIASPLETTEYVLLVTDSNLCQDRDTVIVSVFSDYLVEATNLITPNNDGKNDFWYIINIETYPDVEVLIFDRWGTQVFQMDAYDNTWDGTTSDGKELGEGTYYYVIRFAGNDRIYKGAVNILR